MLVKSIAEGVRISHEIVQWTNLFEINTPPGRPGKKWQLASFLPRNFWLKLWEILPCGGNLTLLRGINIFSRSASTGKFAASPHILIVGIPGGPIPFGMTWIWWSGGKKDIPFWISYFTFYNDNYMILDGIEGCMRIYFMRHKMILAEPARRGEYHSWQVQ